VGAHPLLSIVVTTYQDSENLAATLASIASQVDYARPEVEVVVSDGGSTDGTAAVMKSYGSLVARSRSSRDRGVYDGMNLGANLAAGEWVQFLNSGDTFYRRDSLSIVLRHLASAPKDCSWVIGGAMHIDPISGRESLIRNRPHRWLRHALGLQPHCHQATWVRLTEHRRLGGFRLDLDFVADHAMLMRLGRAGHPSEIPDVVIAYQGGGMSEQRVDEIPWALHTNRVRDLQLGRVGSAMDGVLTSVLVAYASSRRRLGRRLGR
jgi:glycosyltransferase involved in cell wall biosynthesis